MMSMKKNQDGDKGQKEKEEQERSERLEVYSAWAKDEERQEVVRVNAERAIESGLL